MPPTEPIVTVTSTSLLEGLRDPRNRTVWQDYVDRYRPLLVRYVGGLGLVDEDAEDVAQQTLIAFAESLRRGRYERSRGRLRSWMFAIAKRQLLVHRRAKRRRDRALPRANEGPDEVALAGRQELEERWNREWREAVLELCLREARRSVSPETFEAFRRFGLEERPAADVARELGMTANAVFGAKRRVLARVREVMPLIEDVF